MSTSRTAPIKCPACGYEFDSATGLKGTAGVPSDGAVSLCLACGALGFYVDVLGQLTVRAATPLERDDLLIDPRIRQALAVRARVVGSDLQPPKDPQ